jgi:predicted GNAT family N-acyltransferase
VQTTNLIVDVVSWGQERPALQRIRRQVFIDEQGVPEELEWEADDRIATHLLARHAVYGPVACARLLATRQIGRMAVLAEHRHQGIGSALLKKAIIIANAMQYSDVFLHAQTSAMNFYQRFGFAVEGEEYLEAGIPHINMRLQLQNDTR